MAENQKTGGNSAIGGGGFHHVAVRVSDFEASIRFYSEVLGFVERVRWNDAPKRVVLLDTGDGNYLELFEGLKNPATPDDAVWHFAFRTADADAALERARAAGASVWMEPKTLENLGGRGVNARIAFCKGPDGELIEFFQSDAL